jgi:acyl-CoA synthetase (NDP forming)/RimJ/RimL family protein N-acetyltransferase
VTTVRDVILRDGRTLRLRSPAPEDFDAIQAFFDAMAPESRYLRFHGFGATEDAARSYAEADGDVRVALLGRLGDRVVAVAGYERLRDPELAEVAFAVADELQGRGVGTRLLEQLAAIGEAGGVRRFVAEVMPNNRGMLGVFTGAGFSARRSTMDGEVEVMLDLRPTAKLAERMAARDHVAAAASMRPLLAPRSVAVVGASSAPDSVGGALFASIVAGGFCGVATPVNRGGGVVRSVRAATALADLDEAPDLAVLAVPADEVVGAARDAAAAGVGAIVVVAAGFSDAGEAGRAREEELLEVVRASGMRLVGPNSLGVLNTAPDVRLQATIGPVTPHRGRIALSSQSGALGLALLGHAAGRRLGIASFVALGNRADVSTNDLLELWEDDDDVAAITLYVESFGNPQRFSAICQRVSRSKPVLAVRGNRRPPAGAGTGSHTAAALRGEAIGDALLHQAGVLRCGGTEELFDAAELLALQPLPTGRRVGIVTNSGGLGTLAVDACASRGLTVHTLAAATQERIAATAAGADRTVNPVDMGITAAPGDYAAGLAALLDDADVDAVLALHVELGGPGPVAVLEAVEDAARGRDKPVLASVLGSDGRRARLPDGRVPNLRFPEACVAALAHAADRRDWLSRPLGQAAELPDADADAARALAADLLLRPRGPSPESHGRWLEADEVVALLATHAIRVVPAVHCADPDAAVAAAAAVGGPVALKAAFPPPAHAADIDAILLGLQGADGVRAGWAELRRRVDLAGLGWGGVLVQELVAPGADVLVGAVAAPDLGPLVAAGLGGRQAGQAGELAVRLAGLTDTDADELLDAAPGVAARLRGERGRPPLDRPALRDLVLRFARLLETVPELVEADLNPVRVQPEGAAVLDARLRLARRPAAARVKTW